jgi:transposase
MRRADGWTQSPASGRRWQPLWSPALLIPAKQNSSGGKDKLGSISKQGDRYLRSLFTTGALAVIRYAKIHGTDHRPWLTRLLARRPTKVAAIALANKLVRMAWR